MNADEADAAHENKLGKRYRCEVCATEILCVRPGSGSFACHDTLMTIVQLRPLPSSD